ncbi:hypothetical protein AB0H76_30330 [Nocardia sp. NPDC050712]|uniref:hypothetical protein n=1 Tax=Nocardia sp. NPDC050712 TaxID=3155518 RepID=UPI0034072A8C
MTRSLATLGILRWRLIRALMTGIALWCTVLLFAADAASAVLRTNVTSAAAVEPVPVPVCSATAAVRTADDLDPMGHEDHSQRGEFTYGVTRPRGPAERPAAQCRLRMVTG